MNRVPIHSLLVGFFSLWADRVETPGQSSKHLVAEGSFAVDGLGKRKAN